ncbi:hypothetical protein JOL62DRAFT_140733 [Phyllosticta paracitricarpa]|uniref:Uncharacterized protein n=1 Tax=Phyllosticta paracitricarpa TaxID=2016321 RepID=A0ABR1NIR5_9PEZI
MNTQHCFSKSGILAHDMAKRRFLGGLVANKNFDMEREQTGAAATRHIVGNEIRPLKSEFDPRSIGWWWLGVFSWDALPPFSPFYFFIHRAHDTPFWPFFFFFFFYLVALPDGVGSVIGLIALVLPPPPFFFTFSAVNCVGGLSRLRHTYYTTTTTTRRDMCLRGAFMKIQFLLSSSFAGLHVRVVVVQVFARPLFLWGFPFLIDVFNIPLLLFPFSSFLSPLEPFSSFPPPPPPFPSLSSTFCHRLNQSTRIPPSAPATQMD